ncbi:MAG: hypothetical protein QOI76_2987 [Frankiales bacterium]|nr:hypothetical protein [Frankiales bacterium]
MRARSLAAAAAAAALAFAAIPAGLASAKDHPKPPQVKIHPAKAHHPVAKHFTAVGTVLSVDVAAGTVTLADKGGSKDLHKTTVKVLTTAKTKIVRLGVEATLANIVAGDHITAVGTRTTAGLLASHVNVAAAKPAPTPTPSESAGS